MYTYNTCVHTYRRTYIHTHVPMHTYIHAYIHTYIHAAHVSLSHADVAFDTHLVSTDMHRASEALRAGVPIITLPGDYPDRYMFVLKMGVSVSELWPPYTWCRNA